MNQVGKLEDTSLLLQIISDLENVDNKHQPGNEPGPRSKGKFDHAVH